MYKSKLFVGIILMLALIVIGCQKENSIMTPNEQSNETGLSNVSFLKVGRTMVWADGQLYNSIVTKATFKASSGNFDQLYAAGPGKSYKDGIGLISESKPGDQDYNGGRWHLNVLKADVPQTKYENASSVEELDTNDFMSTDQYFECPLLPRNNR
jgi:hypothetical protein